MTNSKILLLLIIGLMYSVSGQHKNGMVTGPDYSKSAETPVKSKTKKLTKLKMNSAITTAYGVDVRNNNQWVRFSPATPGTVFRGVTELGEIFSADFGPDNVFYGLEYIDPNTQLVTIDTASVAKTIIGSVDLQGFLPTGLSWDATTSTMYASSAVGLYTINLTSGASTFIGNFTNTTTMIDIAFNNNGLLYGHDIGADVILQINKTTAEATVIGPTGIDAGFAQGMDFDPTTNILYLAAYFSGGLQELRTVNLLTGATTLVGQIESDIELAGFAIVDNLGGGNPNLTVLSVSPENCLIAGETVDVVGEIQNIGSATATNFLINAYANGVEAANGQATLTPGEVCFHTFEYTVPSGVSSVDLQFEVIAQNDPVVSNDTLTSTINIFSEGTELVFSDDFADPAFTAANWTVTNDGGDGVWTVRSRFDNNYLMPNTGQGNLFSADADLAGEGSSTLTTATFSADLSNYGSIILDFDSDFQALNTSSPDIARVNVSGDGGATWTTVLEYNGTDARAEHIILDLTAELAFSSDARISFVSIQPDWDWWWAIDNVCLLGLPMNPPELTSPANGENNVSTSATLSWNPVNDADTYRVQIALASSFNDTPLIFESAGLTNTSRTFNLAANTTYFWRVNFEIDGRAGPWSAPQNFTTETMITLSGTSNFPAHNDPADFSSSDYRLVGIPGQTNSRISELLTGSQGSDWEVYRDNGATGNDQAAYLDKFTNSANFDLGSGRAFWVIHRGNIVVNKTVLAAGLNNTGGFSIPLQPGGNLITNPFPLTVNWGVVQVVNGINGNLYAYSGSNAAATTQMLPFTGYFYDNTTGANSLLIPYPFGVGTLEKTDPALWRVSVDLTSGELYNRTASFGVAPDAQRGRDELDFHKPRSFGGPLAVAFHYPEWDEASSMFATDIRPEFSEITTWEIVVDAIPNEPATLTFSGIEDVPAEYEIYLLPVSGLEKINLRDNASYRFTPRSSRSKFVIAVGHPSAVENEIALLTPNDFVLGQNYPNPFNPTTAIPVEVPEKAAVNLTIYNVLGEHIATLYSGVLEPGSYWFNWNGRDFRGLQAVSGIYLYRFTVPEKGINISGKMVLLK